MCHAAIRSPVVGVVVVGFLFFLTFAAFAQQNLSPADKRQITDFEKRAKSYVDMRNGLRNKLPKLSNDSTAAEIQTHKMAFRKAVGTARVGVPQGMLFTKPASAVLRRIIKSEFKGYLGAEIRQTVLEADTKGIPLKINQPYPESKELVEMSPALLLALPQLPKELRYRYIGRSLAILDRDIGLIIDFTRNALP